MFDQPSQAPTNHEKINLEEVLSSKEIELGNVDVEISNDDTEINLHKTMNNSPEVVNLVEKISGILSPYFIVLVGLFLYDSNILIGTILIFIGIFSLLKLSWQDIQGIIEKIKKFFTTNS